MEAHMAQQTTVRFIDDLDGSDASGTFDFSLEGRNYQIDLSDDNAAKLRDALAPYIGVARKAGGRGGRRRQQQTAAAEKPARSNREETAAIREWARERGHKVSDRGRIPKWSSRPTKPPTDPYGMWRGARASARAPHRFCPGRVLIAAAGRAEDAGQPDADVGSSHAIRPMRDIYVPR